MMSTLSARQRLLAAAVGLLLAVLAAWFFVVSPKRAEAARLQTELHAADERLAAARLEERSVRVKDRRLAALPTLRRAMPDQQAMSGIIRELNRLAAASGLEFDSIIPGSLQIGQGFRVLPLSVEFQGTFARVSTFLQRLRRQVEVRRGKLRVEGRLYSIESLQFTEGETKFPSLRVTLTLQAFVYDPTATSLVADPTAAPAAEVTP